jgi:biopolymer transport protein ExbB/TolQ
MSALTLIFIAVMVVSVVNGIPLFRDDVKSKEEAARKIGYIKQIGLFGLVVGVLGQMIGFFEGFKAIEEAGDVSFGMLTGGLKVSMITTLYGILIYVISFLIWFGLSIKLR